MKTCNKCKGNKDFEEFGKNSAKQDGLHPTCKTCMKKYKTELAEKHKNPPDGWKKKTSDSLEYRRTWSKNHPSYYTEKKKEWYSIHRDRLLAREKYRYALRSGKLKRKPCAVCGTEEQIEGHHEDYSKPLEVIWLCKQHHSERHAELRSLESD